MILDARIAAFVEWFAAFLQRFGESIERALVPAAQPELPTSIASQPAPADEPDDPISRAIAAARLAHRLETGVKPKLRALREGCESVHDRFVAGGDVDEFIAELATRMGELPETIDAKNGAVNEDEVAPVAESDAVPLRAWLEAMVLERAAPQLRAAIAAAAEDTKLALVELERLQKVFDYYLLAVQRHTGDADQPMLVEEFAEAGLLRTKALVEQFRARRRASASRITAATVRSLSAALEEACAPLRAGRLDEIGRALDDLRTAALVGHEPPPLWSRWYTGMRRAYVRALPIVREVSRDLRALLANEPQAADDGLRKLVSISLDALGAQLPASYRRLFSGMPAEIADLYVARSEPELACREAIDGWLAGGGHSLLVAGDRGAGKRTLVNQVLASVRSSAEVHWVRLSREVCSEAAVSGSIARELGLPEAPTFPVLETALRGLADRRVLVIENAERMFERTVAGVNRMSAFVDLVADTGERTLWILLMSSPAYALLGSALGIATRVTVTVQLDGMSSAELRRVVLARHHLSGYELHFDPPTPRASERLRRPLATTRARRDPETAYFARLAALTDGNPRQALYFWQRTTTLDAGRDRVLVTALPDRPSPLAAKLPVGQRMILALLAQHGSLAVDEVAAAIGVAPDSALSELRFLHAGGWIARGAGTREHWTLAPVAAHPITLELRSGNMV